MSTCSANTHSVWTFKKGWCKCPEVREAKRIYEKRRLAGRWESKKVNPLATIRRIQALMRIGHSGNSLSRRLGRDSTTLHKMLDRQKVYIHPETEAAVKALYHELSMVPGGEIRTVNMAKRKGYAPPMAWDDETIGNPRALPNYDGTREVVK